MTLFVRKLASAARATRPIALSFVLAMGFAADRSAAQSIAQDPLVPVSQLTPVSTGERLTKVGPMARNLWPFNAIGVMDKKLGREVFYITSFNTLGGQLIRLDYQTGEAKSWKMPAGIGSWGIIEAHNGDLYMGSYNEGKLMRFDPRREQWIDLPQADAAFRKREGIICSVAEAPDGSIYYGTYPGAHLVRYDPAAGTVTDLGKAGDENYLRHLVVTPGGIVVARIGTSEPRTLTYDPKTKKFSTLTPKQYQNVGVMPSPILTSKYIVEPMSNQMLVYDVRSLQFLRAVSLGDAAEEAKGFALVDDDHVVFESGKQMRKLDLESGKSDLYFSQSKDVVNSWHPTRDGRLLGIRVQSYLLLDPKKDSLTVHPIPVQGLGQHLLWLRSTPDGFVFGGPELGQTMFSYEPSANLLRSYDQVIDVGGEIYYGVPFEGKIYTISYIEGTLAVFDPSRPWKQGSDYDSNPRMILHMPGQQYRPNGGIHSGPGDKLYIGTQPNYGVTGGALSVFDPHTEKITVYRNLIPDEEISAVATDRHLVYGQSDKFGGGGSKPVATGVHFFVWNPERKKLVFDQVFPDSALFRAITVVNGHAYFVTQDKLWDYDSATNRLSSLFEIAGSPGIPIESLQGAADGTLWAIHAKSLVHLMPSQKRYEVIQGTAGQATSGLTIGRDGTIFFGGGTDLWMYRPEHPTPPVSFGQ
ncbi:MAG: hypothetical protein V4555_01615 [Acidobacteriota bacterium]